MSFFVTYGNEFVVKDTLQPYSGAYIEENGEYFGRWTFSDRWPIIKVSDLVETNIIPKIVKYLPSPSQSDYDAGMFTRYFIKHKLNQPSEILEVNAETYDLIQSEQELPYILYYGISIDWLIDDFGGKVDVAIQNQFTTTNANALLPGIRKYFLNYKEFSKL